MNSNKNTPYNYECNILPTGMQQGQDVSIFNFEQPLQDFLLQQQNIKKTSFSNFINSRNNYLSGLTELGDNWMSGSSKQPSAASIETSKKILNDIGNWYENMGYKNYVYPKIIMSPTPVGGIAFELELFPDYTAYVSILNNDINFDLEENGLFLEYPATKDNISQKLLTLYNKDERRYNSEW